ncbi:glycine cleavage system protein GcvH [candidate division KSB1 bacterium]|nr:glycine cleavage system protein GcvH [candidate division KSB1 bacterium]
MKVEKNLLYTEEHEWVFIENDVATIGITDYAQNELGDIVFVELPDVGDVVNQMEAFGTIEAVKAVSDLFAPLSGTITETNPLLSDKPELINQDPFGEGWMIKIKYSDKSELDALLTADEYKNKIS